MGGSAAAAGESAKAGASCVGAGAIWFQCLLVAMESSAMQRASFVVTLWSRVTTGWCRCASSVGVLMLVAGAPAWHAA